MSAHGNKPLHTCSGAAILPERRNTMHAPIISKIRCHNPNLQRSRVRNRNYLIYIATREGVDLSDTSHNQLLQDEILQTENLSEQSAAPNDLYVNYIAERPRSSGLFGNLQQDDPVVLGNHLANLTAKGQNIYRGIVSLSGQDAIELGYDKKENWEAYMRAVIPDVAAQFGIPVDQLQWTAAVHAEKSHPHCHYMFWSKEQKVCSPYIHVSKQNKCREILSKEMFRAEREQAVIAKTTARDLILDFGKAASKEDFLSLKENLLPGSGTYQIPGHLKAAALDALQVKLLELMNALPNTGRINYAFCTPDLKEKIDAISRDLLSHPDIRKEFSSYMQAVQNISKTYSASAAKTEYSKQAAEKDIYKRLGNIILASAKTLRKEQTAEAHAAKQEEYRKQRQEHLQKRACYTLFRSVFNILCSQSHKKQAAYQSMQSTSKENRIDQARRQGRSVKKEKDRET